MKVFSIRRTLKQGNQLLSSIVTWTEIFIEPNNNNKKKTKISLSKIQEYLLDLKI
jgi:hypothetical protein